ncbi:MAG: hypothetical protein AAGI22_06145 [Planctomycetota bacterium]
MLRNDSRLAIACAAAGLVAPTLASGNEPQVLVLNEIRIDQPGADDDEYFELIGGPPGASLDRVTYLVLGDDSQLGSGVIEAVIPMTAQFLGPTGLFVAGESTMSIGAPDLVTTLDFENSDNVTHLVVEDFSGSIGEDLDLDDDGTLDVLPWGRLYDGVGIVETPGSGDLVYAAGLGLPEVGPDGSFAPAHVFRCIVSPTDWRIGEFAAPGDDTPGAFNLSCSATTAAFCVPPAPNSFSSSGGSLGLDGSGSLQRNDNSLVAISVPSAFGIFVQADMTGAPIVSAIGGNLCLRGAIRRLDSVVFPAGNVARLELDFADPASVESSTMAGVTMHYQFAHRDTIFAGGGNWTSGLSVTWAP